MFTQSKKTIAFAIILSEMVLQANPTRADVPGFGNASPSGLYTTAPNSFDYDQVVLEKDRSYECTVLVDAQNDSISLQFVNDAAEPLGLDANKIREIGNLTPPVTSGSAAANNRLSIQPSFDVSFPTYVKTTNSTGATITTELVCRETSLYGGYNTNANPFNFLELSNTSSGTITAQIRGFNFDGTPTINTSVALKPNSRFDLDVHTAAGRNKYGILVVTHDGPFGAITGYLSQYSGSSGGLTLTGSVPLKTRPNTL